MRLESFWCRTGRLILSGLGAALIAAGAAPAATETEGPVTFSRDVAPIVFAHCVTCHRPGTVAPMSLLSYDEARPWAKSIARVIRARRMPPWSPESEHRRWQNDLSLTAAETQTLIRWVQSGAVEGDPADLPPVPTFTDGWTLGEPDYVITLDAVAVPASGDDIFPQQWVTLDLDSPRWVRAIEFLPGDRRATHHFLATYSTPAGSPSDSKTQLGEQDYAGQGRGGSGVFGVWTAGMPPYVFPEGMGRVLTPETRILVDSHYHAFGEPTTDRTRIGLFFGEGELRKEVATLVAANTGIRIPPGAPDHAERAFVTFDHDMQILAFSPHLHVRGKAMRYELTYPDGRREMLLDVPRYDYNWQWLYYPTEPIDVPAGSRLDVTAWWNNSADNPSNPDPTKEIIYRGDTFNEMFVGFFEAIPKEGVYHDPEPNLVKLEELLSRHPAQMAYLAKGFLPFGLYAPSSSAEEEGWLYLVQGLAMFTISLDDYSWTDGRLEVTTQFPTPQASATTTLIEGELDAEGRLKGRISIGSDTEKPLVFPFLAEPMTAVGGEATGGGG